MLLLATAVRSSCARPLFHRLLAHRVHSNPQTLQATLHVCACVCWLLLQVLLAAVFDLLFSQCDRHGQNLYLKPDGSIVLIDNDQVGVGEG